MISEHLIEQQDQSVVAFNFGQVYLEAARYYFFELRNYHKSRSSLLQALKCKLSFTQKFSVSTLQIDIETQLDSIRKDKLAEVLKDYRNDLQQESSGGEILDPRKILEFEADLKKFKYQTIETAVVLVNFWQMVISYSSFTMFLETNRKVYLSAKEIRVLWRNLKSISPYNLESTKVYSDYLSYVQNNSYKAKQVFLEAFYFRERVKNMTKNNLWTSLSFIFQENSLVVRASASSENLGRIIDISKNCMAVFGYNKEYLRKENIQDLMPPLIAKYHDAIMMLFREGY